MSVINIREARREGARLVIMVAGVSGSGKTRTALEIAYGLSNRDPSKIGVLDTENRRGSLYSKVFEGSQAEPRKHPSKVPFLIGDLYAPFSPARYTEAIHEFQRAGVEVLIIDSGSHEWEGIGGAVDIAEAGNPKLPNWNKAKAEHKKFMNALLTCDMHIILCLRAREKAKPERQTVDGREKLVYVDMGLQAITEKNVLFEATVSLMVHDNGRRQDVVKCPGELLPILGRGQGHITDEDGLQLRQWVDGGVKLDPKVENWRNRLISITERGQAYVDECWAQVPAAIASALGAEFLAMLKASAAEYERQAREAREGDGTGTAGALNDELGGAAASVAAQPTPPDPIEDAQPQAAPEPPAAAEPPKADNDNDPAPKPARRRAGSNPPPPAPADKPEPPANPPAAAKPQQGVDLF